MRFESRVVLDGSQTLHHRNLPQRPFESRVVLDGSQTGADGAALPPGFESRVVLDGSQTDRFELCGAAGLRVVLF